MGTKPDTEGRQVGYHGVNAAVSVRFRVARVYAVVILAWFLFVGHAVAQKASDELATSCRKKLHRIERLQWLTPLA